MTGDKDRTCVHCDRPLKDQLPVNRPIPVTIGRATITICGGCWRSIRPETAQDGDSA